MNALNKTKLQGIIPSQVYNELDGVIAMGINTVPRMAHFLAQTAHESGNFTTTTENLNYSAQGLLATFPTHFSSMQIAENYERNPVKIANNVYANRMGNGSETSGDGYKFRGRGYIQLTGEYSYKLFGESIGVDVLSNPDLVATTYPLRSAAWFFVSNHILAICDQGIGHDVVELVTKRINGGINGLDDRIAHFDKYLVVLNG